MGKLLLWFVVVLGVMMVARMISANKARAAGAKASRPRSGFMRKAPEKAVEHMVRCAHCGIHLPRSEAVMSAGQTFCGAEHAKLGVTAEPRHG
jgi:uncharacterized protein